MCPSAEKKEWFLHAYKQRAEYDVSTFVGELREILIEARELPNNHSRLGADDNGIELEK